MLDFEALAQAMGELDEDTVKEMLTQVMDEGGAEAVAAMEACQKGIAFIINIICTKGDSKFGLTNRSVQSK